MKRYTYCAFLMMFMVIPILGIPYEHTVEYAQKQAILNERAAKFKSETGFIGSLQSNYISMKNYEYFGQFPDIKFPTTKDSTLYKQTFYTILDRITPYISASRQHLVENHFSISKWDISIGFVQWANGYPIETGGRLIITYYPNQCKVMIIDETVDIPPVPAGSIISEEEAYSIAWGHYHKSKNFDEKSPRVKRKISILYRSRILDGKQQPFRLCWKVAFPKVLYYIDAITSEFYTEGYVINNEYSYYISGNRYDFDSSFSPLGPQPLKGIKVTNGSDDSLTDENGIVKFPVPLESNYQVTLMGDRFSISSFGSPMTLTVNNSTDIDTCSYETCVSDSIATSDSTYSSYSPNILHNIVDHDKVLKNFDSSYRQQYIPT